VNTRPDGVSNVTDPPSNAVAFASIVVPTVDCRRRTPVGSAAVKTPPADQATIANKTRNETRMERSAA
jgi:hypothetical protein